MNGKITGRHRLLAMLLVFALIFQQTDLAALAEDGTASETEVLTAIEENEPTGGAG
ncbi:MAG: hypothetical protein LUI14_10200 [Lachnospiraceae bacterium]|nr:hypothetical protein [Lachnospiraceae bacterium]